MGEVFIVMNLNSAVFFGVLVFVAVFLPLTCWETDE